MVIEMGMTEAGYWEVVRLLASYPHTGIVTGDNLISATYSAPDARMIAMGAIVKRVGEEKIEYYER